MECGFKVFARVGDGRTAHRVDKAKSCPSSILLRRKRMKTSRVLLSICVTAPNRTNQGLPGDNYCRMRPRGTRAKRTRCESN